MRTMKTRTATALGALALTASGFGAIASSPAAEAAGRNGACEPGEFCYNFNSDLKGSWSDFTKSVGDYGTSQPGCYEFKGAGAGKGKCIKNDAGGYWNRTGKTVTVFFNSGFGGKSVQLKPGTKGKLPAAVYNENASHRIGGGSTPPPTGKTPLSQGLYSGGGGKITAGFDGYNNTPGRHEGIDIVKGYGSRVNSLTNGVVLRAGGDSINTLAIYLPKVDKTVIYLHSKPTVKSGQTVKRGQQIATEANVGAPTHTHVEMRPGKQRYASKSVGDPVLNNPDPTKFWNSQGYVEK